jgi:uncharacterized LabA/DUF88 family protein
MNEQRPPRQRRPRNPQGQANQAPKKPNNYAFIDSQNLNLGVQKIGWKMDWRKFRLWLEEKYGVTHAFMFIGYMLENESLYELMHEHGYLIVLKPTLEIKAPAEVLTDEQIAEKIKNPPTPLPEGEVEKPKMIVKGNIDADLVLYAMKELPNYDKALIVSGDGDFLSLIEYLALEKKLLKVLAPNRRYSTLLKEFDEYIEGIDQHRGELAYRDRRYPRKPKS